MFKEVVTIANSEIGYKEKPNNNTKYGEWYGLNGAAWCVMFVQWCYHTAGFDLPFKTASCSNLLSKYKTYIPEHIVETPEPGDIVIYNFGHCGIVKKISGNQLITIEGNTSPGSLGSQNNGEGVYEKVRRFSQVTAFIRPYIAEKDAPSTWSSEARTWNESSHIFKGDSTGNMNWSSTLTREEAVTVLYRLYKYIKGN